MGRRHSLHSQPSSCRLTLGEASRASASCASNRSSTARFCTCSPLSCQPGRFLSIIDGHAWAVRAQEAHVNQHVLLDGLAAKRGLRDVRPDPQGGDPSQAHGRDPRDHPGFSMPRTTQRAPTPTASPGPRSPPGGAVSPLGGSSDWMAFRSTPRPTTREAGLLDMSRIGIGSVSVLDSRGVMLLAKAGRLLENNGVSPHLLERSLP